MLLESLPQSCGDGPRARKRPAPAAGRPLPRLEPRNCDIGPRLVALDRDFGRRLLAHDLDLHLRHE